MVVHSRHVARRWKMLCQLHEAGYVRRQSFRAHWTEAGCRHSAREVLTDIVEQYHDWCRTLKYTVWTEFCSTLAASGAASGEMVHASGQKHHRGCMYCAARPGQSSTSEVQWLQTFCCRKCWVFVAPSRL